MNLLFLRGEFGAIPQVEIHWLPFLIKYFRVKGYIDVEPVNILPTWRKGRGDQDYVAKRLNRFLISEKFVVAGLK